MDNVTADIAASPVASRHTLRQRQSLVFQLWRFVVLNIRFVTMISKGEH